MLRYLGRLLSYDLSLVLVSTSNTHGLLHVNWLIELDIGLQGLLETSSEEVDLLQLLKIPDARHQHQEVLYVVIQRRGMLESS